MLARLTSFTLAVVSAVACGGGGTSGVDAPPADAHTVDGTPGIDAPAGQFACLGQALPTTAPDPLTIAGTAQQLNGLSTANASGVALSVFKAGNGTAVATTTSAADGSFTLSPATAGAPLDGFLKATKATYFDYYLYPGTPLALDLAHAPVLVLNASNFQTIDALAGVTAPANPNVVGLLGVFVQDCAGTAVAGATISVKLGGAEVGDKRYVAGSVPSSTAMMTDAKGAAFVFNIPQGTVTVTASVGGVTLRAHDVVIHGGATHATVVVP